MYIGRKTTPIPLWTHSISIKNTITITSDSPSTHPQEVSATRRLQLNTRPTATALREMWNIRMQAVTNTSELYRNHRSFWRCAQRTSISYQHPLPRSWAMRSTAGSNSYRKAVLSTSHYPRWTSGTPWTIYFTNHLLFIQGYSAPYRTRIYDTFAW